MKLIEFECRGHRFAMPLDCVRRVVPGVMPTPLPGAPDIVLGALNLGGEILAVINFNRRIGVPFSGIDSSQFLLVSDLSDFPVGFVVDKVNGVIERDLSGATVLPERFAAGDFVEAVARLDDGLCVIIDPEQFLFDEEKSLLGDALEKVRHDDH
ncbi:chemotaxis protein CheW [Herbaspirillum sp. ST 5-3]|uniref:chemotaxis protein CheW n=1 Tax=Oxalobacteraceae TaxID=75682 RepID=UPI0010A50BAC|nr:chemotaxis protein CheW [Herbaspirillum sp. ST 5-3]